MQSGIQIKVTKHNFTCNKCTDKERFKTLPDDTQCNCYNLVTIVLIKIWYAQFVQHKSNTDICSNLTTQLHTHTHIFVY